MVYARYDRSRANPFKDTILLEILEEEDARTLIASSRKRKRTPVNTTPSPEHRETLRVFKASYSMCRALSSPVTMFRVKVKQDKILSMCGAPVRIFGEARRSKNQKKTAHTEDGEIVEEHEKLEDALCSRDRPTLLELKRFAIQRGYLSGNAQALKLLWNPATQNTPSMDPKRDMCSRDYVSTAAAKSALVRLMTWSCLGAGSWQDHCDYVDHFKTCAFDPGGWMRMLRKNPVKFAMLHEPEPPRICPGNHRELWESCQKLRRYSRYGASCIVLQQCDPEDVGTQTDTMSIACVEGDPVPLLVWRSVVKRSDLLASLLIEAHKQSKLVITPRNTLDYLQHEYKTVRFQRESAGNRVSVVGALEVQLKVLGQLMYIKVENIRDLHPRKTVVDGPVMHVVILSDAHRINEQQMLDFMQWCLSVDAGKIIMFGVAGCVPPACEGAGQPFQDLLSVLAPRTHVIDPVPNEHWKQRPRTTVLTHFKEVLQDRLISHLQDGTEVPSWMVLCADFSERTTMRNAVTVFVKKHEARYRNYRDAFPADGGKDVCSKHILMRDEVPLVHYDLIVLAPQCQESEYQLALECTTRTTSFILDLRGESEGGGGSRPHLLRRNTYLRQVLKRSQTNFYS